MGKKHRQGNRSSSGSAASSGQQSSVQSARETTTAVTASSSTEAPSSRQKRTSFFRFLQNERKSVYRIFGIAALGAILAFGVGAGYLTGDAFRWPHVSPWRQNLGKRVRLTAAYQITTFQNHPWIPLVTLWTGESEPGYNSQKNVMGDPSHTRVFEVLREAIVREKNGFVHPDLGMLTPAPCGAARGLGMVRDSYSKCARNCTNQDEILLRVPLGFQMTRRQALDTLIPLFPKEKRSRKSLAELDDAALLVLLLAHERTKSRRSRWVAYIASLPTEPSCGYWKGWRPYMNDAIEAMTHYDVGWDLSGWPNELNNAGKYADKIASGLAHDFGGFLGTLKGVQPLENIQWALCQVASRATAGSERFGSLRLVPMLDMINHEINSGGFVELTGEERIVDGDFVDATEVDGGAFVVRSLRYGRRKPLKKGQELLANYNVRDYTPLDWFVSLGFVPPELWHRWEKLDAALPRLRRDRSFLSANTQS